MLKVFFDSSVLFSAIYSDKGASRKLVELVKKKVIVGIITENVIEELKANILKFKTPISSSEIDEFIQQSQFLVREEVSLEEIQPYLNLVEEKDAHILAGAILTKSDFLVTLDKKHLNNKSVKEKVKEVIIISPKEFLLKIIKSL